MLEADSPYWIYRYERPDMPGKWTKVLQPESASSDDGSWPAPRYAHQVVYDTMFGVVYMHGGNSSLEAAPIVDERRSGARRSGPAGEIEVRIEFVEPVSRNARLDDFWTMKLVR